MIDLPKFIRHRVEECWLIRHGLEEVEMKIKVREGVGNRDGVSVYHVKKLGNSGMSAETRREISLSKMKSRRPK
jgi:hypothetical protein